MTYEEALEEIKAEATEYDCFIKCCLGDETIITVEKRKQRYKTVIHALEKATKKKPNIENTSYYSDFKCPSCNTKIISKFKDDSYIGKKERYCHVCGQRLEWSSRK